MSKPNDLDRTYLPLEIGEYARLMEDAPTAKERLGNALTLAEAIAGHMSGLLLSAYGECKETLPGVEKQLIDKAVSFGDHVAVVRECLQSKAALRVLRCEDLQPAESPLECDRFARIWQGLVDARQNYECHPRGAITFAEERLPQGKQQSKTHLADFLARLVNVRNGMQHKLEKKVWSEEPVWYEYLDARLRPAMQAFLAWEPVQTLLQDYEFVQVERCRRSEFGWIAEVVRALADPLIPVGGREVSTPVERRPDTRYVARRAGFLAEELLCTRTDMRTLAAQRMEERKATYRKVLTLGLLRDGHKSEAVKDELRRALLSVGKLADSDERSIESALWAALTPILLGTTEERAKLVGEVLPLPSPSDDPTLSTLSFVELTERTALAVREWIKRNVSPTEVATISAQEIADQLGMPREVALKRFVEMENERDPRVVALEQGTDTRIQYFLVLPLPLTQRIEDLWKDARTRLETRDKEALKLWRQMAGLWRTMNDLLPPSARYTLEIPEAAEEHDVNAPVIEVGGKVFTVTSRAQFFTQLAELMASDKDRWASFEQSLPWTWGRVRRLAAKTPEAEAGRNEMTNPSPWPSQEKPRAWFDLNVTAADAAYCAVQHLRKVGLDAAFKLDQPGRFPDASALLASPPPKEPALALVISPGDRGSESAPIEPFPVEDTDIPTFVARFVAELWKQGLLGYQDLPLRGGRSQHVASLLPRHPNGQDFRQPARFDKMFLETSWSQDEVEQVLIGAAKQLGLEASMVEEDAAHTEADGGVWYVNVGNRSWDDCRRLGFWSAGGGRRYRAAVERLSEGDQMYAYASGYGYVGAGVVTGSAERIEDFLADRADIDESTRSRVEGSRARDDDDAEYAIRVRWTAVRSFDRAERKKGMFASPMTACRLAHEETLAFLRERLADGSVAEELQSESGVATYEALPPARSKPHAVTLPDGVTAVRSWKEVLVTMGNFLVRQELFRPDLRPSGKSRRLIFSADAQGLSAQAGELSNGWWIETAMSCSEAMKFAGGLLLSAGQDPSCFSVDYRIVRGEGASEREAL